MKNWSIQIEDRLAVFTLKTGKKGNRLTPETFIELNEALTGLDLSAVRGLILKADGPDFCQGFDLNFMLTSDGNDSTDLEKVFKECNDALSLLYNLPIPSLSIVQGSCIGGGLLMALATDFRLADENAKFGFPEVKQSLVVNLGLKRVYQLIGEARTKELVLLGNPISAKKMEEWGVLNWVTKELDFKDRIQFFKDYINSMPPLALKANKELISSLSTLSLEDSIVLENSLQIDVLRSADLKEAISSFLEKRRPIFKGK